ncbi:CoA transferase [Albimonas sp. CAU 1670]|uniref:CaiB/BaiF CoA transferase family protein n=1 Tax=Albimonas sp. CAU 1670 TaxID=3032599 RepID=UPI0023DA5650|nr:CoA transferase [Albimonas sp. CAU 1670]MDF2231759.1 CoA transferase [Albimonas sp. CAU 1670]
MAQQGSQSQAGALAGVRVLDLGGEVAAAYCAALFAANGADVLRIEPPAGDVVRRLPPFAEGVARPEGSGMQMFLDAGKRSLALDHSAPRGAEIVRALARDADLVIEALPPERAEALDLPAAAPDAVHLSLSWFGREGPGRDWRGTDAVAMAAGAFLYPIGPEEGPPLVPGGHQSQINGGLVGYVAAMTALMAREAGDGGARVDLSLAEAQAAYAESGAVRFAYDGVPPRNRKGVNLFPPIAPQTIFPCADGWVGVTCVTPMQWRAMCTLVGAPELADDPRFAASFSRFDNIEALYAELVPRLKTKPAAYWFHEGQKARIPTALVPTMEDLSTLDHLRAREAFGRFEHPDAPAFEAPAIPWKMSGTPPARGGRAPRLGEHGREVLSERLGLSSSDIDALIAQGVLHAPELVA